MLSERDSQKVLFYHRLYPMADIKEIASAYNLQGKEETIKEIIRGKHDKKDE